MYVLADLEWIVNAKGNKYPTQLAALRVDQSWNTVDSFSVLFHPKDSSYHLWTHIAYTGWEPTDYLSAAGISANLHDFASWLLPDDTVCWWHPDSLDHMQLFAKMTFNNCMKVKMQPIRDYVFAHLAGQGDALGNPYQLCAARGIETPTPKHCAENDVLAMQNLLTAIALPQSDLLDPPPHYTHFPLGKKGSHYPLLYDPDAKLLHRSDCALLSDDAVFPAFQSFRTCISKHYRPCVCCRSDYMEALKARNERTLARVEYHYIYTKHSSVFHTSQCSHLWYAREILGTVTYNACVRTGRTPCKDCAPQPIKRTHHELPQKKVKQPIHMEGRALTKDEERAVRRFRQAKEERESAFKKDDLSEQERQKVLALTHPGLAFWSSRGYRTFHLRNCPKLAGLTALTGFSRYQDAVNAGYRPCRFCKPSNKHDVAYSIPITNQVRQNETVDMLRELCKKNNLPWEFNGSIFSLQTAVGKWKIYTNIRPVKLEHINLVYNFGNSEEYHVQPRLFLSLVDTFEYILRHDQQLLAKQQNVGG